MYCIVLYCIVFNYSIQLFYSTIVLHCLLGVVLCLFMEYAVVFWCMDRRLRPQFIHVSKGVQVRNSLYNIRTNLLYCIALYCIALYCTVLYCIIVLYWYCLVLLIVSYQTLLFCPVFVRCSLVLYFPVLCCIFLSCVVLYYTVWYGIVLFGNVLYFYMASHFVSVYGTNCRKHSYPVIISVCGEQIFMVGAVVLPGSG